VAKFGMITRQKVCMGSTTPKPNEWGPRAKIFEHSALHQVT